MALILSFRHGERGMGFAFLGNCAGGFDSHHLTRYKTLNGGAMPFYEFTCDCGHIAEVFFEMNDDKRIICEGCKKKLMQRKYSLGGTIFKGEGWGGK